MAAIDAALEILRIEPGPLVDLPHYKEMRGACKGLDEIEIGLDDEREFRILCFRGPGHRECTLLCGFERDNDTAKFSGRCVSARWRKRGVLRNGRRAPSCHFP